MYEVKYKSNQLSITFPSATSGLEFKLFEILTFPEGAYAPVLSSAGKAPSLNLENRKQGLIGETSYCLPLSSTRHRRKVRNAFALRKSHTGEEAPDGGHEWPLASLSHSAGRLRHHGSLRRPGLEADAAGQIAVTVRQPAFHLPILVAAVPFITVRRHAEEILMNGNSE